MSTSVSVSHAEYGIQLDAIDGCTIERNNVSRSERLDCFWDGSGSSNAFARNSCTTEEPPGAWD